MNPNLGVWASENGEANDQREARNGGFAEGTKNKFDEVSLLKHGSYDDLPTAKISELMKLMNLENSSTKLLFSVVNKLLDGSIERKNRDVPQSMAFLLKKVVQEIERWVSTQAENFQKQNNLYKIHEEKCKQRVRVLETLTFGLAEENEVIMNQLQRIKAHPGVSKQERKTLCRLMDNRKLSPEASLHAAQNERLPVRAVFQVLFSEQTKITRQFDWSGSFSDTRSSPNLRLLEPPARCLSKQEVTAQKTEIKRLRDDVLRLQSQCIAMQGQIERMLEKKSTKGFFRWEKLEIGGFRSGGGVVERIDEGEGEVEYGR